MTLFCPENAGTMFELAEHVEPVLKLMQKYSNMPMSLADACLA
jgi:hypothetical protein